jgi:hypothetical protein
MRDSLHDPIPFRLSLSKSLTWLGQPFDKLRVNGVFNGALMQSPIRPPLGGGSF